MAKGDALFIGWGEVPSGKGKKALKVFNEGVEYWKRMQQKGEIESVEPFVLAPHGGDLAGFTLVKGDREKLNRIRNSPEFQSLHTRVGLIVRNLGVIEAYFGEELQSRMGEWAKQAEELD